MITLNYFKNYPNTVQILQKWIIAQDCTDKNNSKHYFYVGSNVDLDKSQEQQLQDVGYEKEDYKNMRFLSYYTSEDLAEIFGNELEDQNKHSLRNLFRIILHSLKDADVYISDSTQCLILCNIFDNLFSQ